MTEPMIITRLFGGAGNQLFQYAAGRALADHLGCDLAVDGRYVGAGKERNDCFEHFAQARILRDVPLPPAKSDGMIRYGLWRKFGHSPRFYREENHRFDAKFFDLPSGTYLHGYWQSPKYFAAIEDQLRKDLRFTTPLSDANARMAKDIEAAPTPVSLHVRRGDYTASGSYAACTPDYYRAAVAKIHTQAGKPLTCFIFSNDPVWARDNLNLRQETVVVDLNDENTGHFDLHLMSRCAHHVIANSTFSWWGAWLNPEPSKMVIAPKPWFSPNKPDNPDLCPPEWLRLRA